MANLIFCSTQLEPRSTVIPTLKKATQKIIDFAKETWNYTKPFMAPAISVFLHDAFYMFGLALNESLRRNTSLNDGLKYMEYIKCTNFKG